MGSVKVYLCTPRQEAGAGGVRYLFLQGTTIANFKIDFFDGCNLYERLSPILI